MFVNFSLSSSHIMINVVFCFNTFPTASAVRSRYCRRRRWQRRRTSAASMQGHLLLIWLIVMLAQLEVAVARTRQQRRTTAASDWNPLGKRLPLGRQRGQASTVASSQHFSVPPSVVCCHWHSR